MPTLILFSIMLVLASSLALAAPGFAHSQLKNPPMNPQEGKMWMDLAAGDQASLNIDNEYLAITQWNFTVDKDLSSPGVMVYGLVTIPTELPEPPGRAYQYFKLDYNNMVSGDITDSTFLFEISKAWLDEAQNSPELVSLFASTDGIWEEVATRVVAMDEETVKYYTEAEDAKYLIIAVRGAPSNFEDFQTVDSTTLFLQKLGSDEVEVIETENGTVTEVSDLEPKEELEEVEEPVQNISQQTFDKDVSEEEVEVDLDEGKGTAGLILLWILILGVLAFILYRWKTKPKIEQDVINKIKKRK